MAKIPANSSQISPDVIVLPENFANGRDTISPSISRETFIESALVEFESALIGYAFTIINDMDRARDVAQDTFTRLCQQDLSKVEASLKRWLFTVCRNRALDILHKEKRVEPLEEIRWKKVAGVGLQPDEEIECKERLTQLNVYLERLSENQREVILLKFQQGFSYQDIRKIIGLRAGDIGFLIDTGLKRLRDLHSGKMRASHFTPFAIMKLKPEDTRLTAFVLGELGPKETAAVEKVVAADPALRSEIEKICETEATLSVRLELPPSKLLPLQRGAVLNAAREPLRPTKLQSIAILREKMQPWVIPASAAVVLALATFLLIRKPGGTALVVAEASAPPAISHTEIDQQPAAGPKHSVEISPAPTATGMPALHSRTALQTTEQPVLELPINAGKSSMDWISKAIRIDHELPPSHAVRLEEILNSFQIRLKGTTAIARGNTSQRHPHTPDSGMPAHLATLSTEMVACPWKPSSTLLLVSIRGNSKTDCKVALAYHANVENVARYRLLGYAAADIASKAELPKNLAAAAETVIAVEIEPKIPNAELGTLVWTADEMPAPSITLQQKVDSEPSDDARFAALVCTFSQWLSGEQGSMIDAEVVAALARETASTTLPADRSDFLNLINRSLNL